MLKIERICGRQWVTIADRTMTLVRWCKELDQDYDIVRGRLREKWDLFQALNVPTRRHRMITPESYAQIGTEHAHQVALFMWIALPEQRQRYPELQWLFAIPNGGERGKGVAGRLKAEGVKPGVPDLCLPLARHGVHGLYVELKRPKSVGRTEGVVSSFQKQWHAALKNNGYGVAVCYGWIEARDCLIRYLED